jgi:hypothetical protein
MPGSLGQLARQRFGGDHFAGLSRFTIKPPSTPPIESPGKVSRFHKGPRQISVAAFAVVVAFLLIVARARRIHGAAIAGKVKVKGAVRTNDNGGAFGRWELARPGIPEAEIVNCSD